MLAIQKVDNTLTLQFMDIVFNRDSSMAARRKVGLLRLGHGQGSRSIVIEIWLRRAIVSDVRSVR
jgi:hypothetical protein